MFTGLIEETGTVAGIEDRPGGRRLWIAAARVLEGARIGDSLALDGCCLTLVAVEPRRVAVEAVPETLRRTTLGDWRPGARINLERPLRLDQRLGGHLVQGHIDGVGTVRAVSAEGEGRRVAFELPAPLLRFVAEKGSLAVDGVSLTIAACDRTGCEIAYIRTPSPRPWPATTSRGAGSTSRSTCWRATWRACSRSRGRRGGRHERRQRRARRRGAVRAARRAVRRGPPRAVAEKRAVRCAAACSSPSRKRCAASAPAA